MKNLVAVLAVLLCASVALYAQGGESTEILGVVTDSSGSVVPGAEVTATHLATGQSRKLTTG